MNRGKEALVVTNITREQPGTILDILRNKGWRSNLVNLDRGTSFPPPKNFGVLIVMGGPPSANDSASQTPWMPTEITRIQEALAENVPYLGVCLGFQALVKAAGGEVIKSPRKEVGFRYSYIKPIDRFYAVKLTEEGRRDPLFESLPDELPVFHLHGETVRLPPTNAKLLATGSLVPNQIVKIGENAYGTQGHFELTPRMLNEWLKIDPDLLALGPEGVAQVKRDFQLLQGAYIENAMKLFTNFLNLIS